MTDKGSFYEAMQAASMVQYCLSDIRVLELGQVLAAPFAGMILGDLGAEVVKVEPPGGDHARKTPPCFYKGESIYFMTLNRNKKSIALDLADSRGREVFYDLVRKSDIVLDNFRCGVLDKLGIHYEALCQINPGIICCSINGYGSDTPDRDKPSFDLMVQARGGGMSLTGEPGGAPVRMGVSITDHTSGIYAATAILAALHHRQKTGRGQKLEVPLFSTMIALLSYEAGIYLHSGQVPGPVGSGHRSLVPYSAVATSNGHIVIDAHLPKFWSALCRALEQPGLETDPRFAQPDARNQNRQALMEILNECFSKKESQFWLEVLEAEGVPCAPINDMKQALNDPAVEALNMVVDIEHQGTGLRFAAPGNPMRFFGTSDVRLESPPMLGEHSKSIARDLLGYSDEKIDGLLASGVLTGS